MKNIFWIQGRIFLQKEIQCRQAYGQIQSIRDCHAMIMIHDEFNQNYDNSGMLDIFRATMPIRETRDGSPVSRLFSPGSENCSLSGIICLPLHRKSASHPALSKGKTGPGGLRRYQIFRSNHCYCKKYPHGFSSLHIFSLFFLSFNCFVGFSPLPSLLLILVR